MSTNKDITFNQVLDFWFGSFDANGEVIAAKKKRWWNKDPKFDAQVTLKFSQAVLAADQGEFDHWQESAKGRLGLIILLDQFPRHIWRGQPQSFAYVDRVLKICQAGIEVGQDKELNLVERQFFYLPLMHSESLSVQEQSLVKYQDLVDDAPPHRKKNL